MFAWDGALCFIYKMAHTPLKVPDDHMMMCMQSFNFQRRRYHSKFYKKKGSYKEQNYPKTTWKVIRKCSAQNSALRLRKMWVFLNYLLYFLASSQNHVLEKKKKHGIPFPVLVPLPFCIMLMPPHIHLIPDLDPGVIPKITLERADHKIQKRNFTKFIAKSNYTHFKFHFSLSNWKGKRALTSLSICSLNSLHSLAIMSLYFL